VEKLATRSGRVDFFWTHQDVQFDRKERENAKATEIKHVTDVVSHSCYIVLRCPRMPCTLALVQDRPSTRPVVALCTVPHTLRVLYLFGTKGVMVAYTKSFFTKKEIKEGRESYSFGRCLPRLRV
jgi:hypothetical protein